MLWWNSKEKIENPFDTKPSGNVIGIEEEKRKIVDYVKKRGVCFLTGPSGIGKTSLVRWIESTLKQHKLVYIDAKDVEETFNLRKHLLKQGNCFMKLLKMYPKNMVVIVDEAQEVDKRFIDTLQTLWDKNVIKSIIIVQISSNLNNFPESFVKRIGDRVIRLKKLNFELLKKILESRTGGKKIFDEKAMQFIARKADFVPRSVLQKCEVVSTELNQTEEIGLQEVKYIFNKKEEEELDQAAEMDIFDTKKVSLKSEALLSFDKVDENKRLTESQKVIVKLLIEGKKTTKQVAAILNKPAKETSKILDALVSLGMVSSSGKPKVYEISEKFKQELMFG